jgi:predicted RNase H-like nuclease
MRYDDERQSSGSECLAPYLGLDGFRGGWVAAWIDDHGHHGFDYSTGVKRLLSTPHTRAMIDIPIGLKKFGRRICDVSARELLGSSVFLGARRDFWKFPDQASANQYYWWHEGPGKGLSCQLWNIRCKIKEVDEFITPARQANIGETHPELIFWKLNGCVHLESKKSATGRDQRTEILRDQGFIKITKWLAQRHGTGIGRDDLIDACACAVAARDSTSRLGGDEVDVRGLRMEINY